MCQDICALDLECKVRFVCRKWQKIHSIVGIVYDPVHDVAFAPNLGRLAAQSRSAFYE